MVSFYIDKIRNGEINASTGKAWDIGDVPSLWRKKVEAGLAE